ncbi:5-oxoprolinase subunit PxpB [Phosphitispora sp. TUW77]|uniref:5-oxoprolinase subunit PxpB n=1 Tax=Phosphitispora sp. TUW77 TaxID=3152361 RepID=UPI003AB1807A
MNLDIRFMGDSALVIVYSTKHENNAASCTMPTDSNRIQLETARIQQDYISLYRELPKGITDIVPCYSSIGVYYNPVLISPTDVEGFIRKRLTCGVGTVPAESMIIPIPVRYGGEYGPDLKEAADILSMTPEEVIHEHCFKTYTVWAIGFLPGFPYMGRVSSKIVLPRKETPAGRVAAGSVAIAGYQTGIYPYDSPGGWYIIGRTDMKMFDPKRAEPCFLKPGDRVRFVRQQ